MLGNFELIVICLRVNKGIGALYRHGKDWRMRTHFEPSFTATDITFKDENSDIEADVFSGSSYYTDFGYVNANISYLRLGGATSAGPGKTNGVDLGISGGAGISDVRDSHFETCGCPQK